MSKEIYISSTPHETRLAIVEKDELSEIYYERENEYTLAGSIYNGRVTRVLPGMQSAFVDVGLERDAFLYITDFLEEQGESADFEGGEPRRGAERNGDRQSERGGRSGRGREQPREAVAEEPSFSEPIAQTADEEREERPSEAGEETQEGSRTWRGRRGRRRGRGGEHRGHAVASEPAVTAEEPATSFPDEAELEPLESLQGAAQEAVVPAREARPREERGREGRGRERGSRDRSGGRDRFPQGEEAGEVDLSAAAAAEPFILPGESLSKYRKGDEAGAAAEASASRTAKPQISALTARPSTEIDFSVAPGWDGGFVLPGESLSRRRASSVETSSAPSRTEEDVSLPESAAQAADAESKSGGDRRRERDRQRGRGGRNRQPSPEAAPISIDAEAIAEEPTPSSFHSGVASRERLDPAEAVQPGVTSQHEPEAADLGLNEAIVSFEAPLRPTVDAPGYEVGAFATRQSDGTTRPEDIEYVPETDVVPAATDAVTEAVLDAVDQLHNIVASSAEPSAAPAPEEFHEETTEYEPGEDASASYRVDPAGPSEFRQSSAETEVDPIGVRFGEGDESGPTDKNHAFTSVQTSGEMLSEVQDEVEIPGANEDPTNPIEHETAVQSVHLREAEGTLPTAQAAEAGTLAPPQLFAPGAGQLEEEMMDDDDDQLLLDVAASYSDDMEEETFEAGAQIGSLARDRALEQLARAETTLIEEEEDDFDIDEEEMEEDELDGSEEIAASDIAEAEEEDDALEDEALGFDEEGEKPLAAAMGEFPEFAEENAGRGDRSERSAGRQNGHQDGNQNGHQDGRQDGRGREQRGGATRDRGGRGGRDRRGMANSRSNGGRPSRHSMQTTDLPAISDLLKPGQEVLVQIAKEPIAKKGARITSHIALPGRFLVFMPTVNHVGVSRKIESDGERRRLKEILLSEKGEAAGGFIVRTAALGASEDELRSDLRFLLNLWADIKQRSESSKSPALIYHDLNLVERILRDQVTDNFSAIWCDTETEYERVLRFLQRFQPSLMRRVKLYTKDTPLFEQFGISEEINKALRSKVWLKSGGSIVINQTEALVAIDINTGKFVGKTARLEDTIVKTNLDAIPEIVRQIRLRDLGGIIVIDFIDMDDRKNRARVLAALEEELKNDRAPSKVLQFNDFGLVAITRKRVKQSLERTLSTTCGICAGTGMVKSPITVCNEIYIELRKMHKQLDKGDVMLRVNPEVVKQLKSGNGKWLQEMEEICGKTILIKSDPSLHPEQFDIH